MQRLVDVLNGRGAVLHTYPITLAYALWQREGCPDGARTNSGAV